MGRPRKVCKIGDEDLQELPGKDVCHYNHISCLRNFASSRSLMANDNDTNNSDNSIATTVERIEVGGRESGEKKKEKKTEKKRTRRFSIWRASKTQCTR